MNELKPCPFCGGEALMRERYINGIANTKHYRRECRHCKATFAHWFRSIKRANEAWNRRATLNGCENELIVRCGECLSAKWYESGDFYCQKWGERCDSPYTLTGQSKTDFCSHGSKKECKEIGGNVFI